MNKKTFRIALIAAAVLTLTACSSTYKNSTICLQTDSHLGGWSQGLALHTDVARSEERRVGKECRSRWSPYH